MTFCATRSRRCGGGAPTGIPRSERPRLRRTRKWRCPTSVGKALSIAALLVALLPSAFAQPAKKAASVELLYVAAADCGFCRRWEANYLNGRTPKPALDWAKGVRFTMVDIGTFRARFSASDAPAHLQP